MVKVAKRPVPVREEVTPGQICDEPRPVGRAVSWWGHRGGPDGAGRAGL